MPDADDRTDRDEHGAGPGLRVLADAGNCSADNLDRAAEFVNERVTEFDVEPGPSVPLPGVGAVTTHQRSPRAGGSSSPRTQRVAGKRATRKGRAAYARRKATIEPVFGQVSTVHNAKQLLLRGRDQVRGEWHLLAACHNRRKLHGVLGVHGLTAVD